MGCVIVVYVVKFYGGVLMRFADSHEYYIDLLMCFSDTVTTLSNGAYSLEQNRLQELRGNES